MWLKNFTLALRQMRRDPRTTSLHFAGLTLGIAGFLLILQYVFFERSYDQFHTNADRLFRISVDIERNGRPNMASAATYAGVGPALKNDFPEVETFARMANGESTVRIRDMRFWETFAWYVDTDFFTMFTLPLLAGDARSALAEPGSVVISEKIALKYFGRTDCLGESLEAENFFGNRLYKITGVAKNLPENTHLTGEIFFAYSTLATRPNFVPDWGWRDFKNYVLLKNAASRESFEEKITSTDWIGSKSPAFGERQMRHKILLQPVPGIYLSGLRLEQELKTGGDPAAVRYLLLIAALVLGMAWMNYVNLSTAKAIERAREIGIRRAIGAQRGQVIGQFVTHSLLLNGGAFLLAISLAAILQPLFANLIGKPVGFVLFENKAWLAGIFGLFALGLLISSVYPAWAISGFSPLRFLSGKTQASSGSVWLRKGLIVFQFGVSVALIAGTAIVWQQLDFMRHQDLGMDIDQTLAMRAPRPTDSVTYSKYLVFKQRLLENPAIRAVTASSNVPGDEDTWNNGVRRYNAANPADQTGIIAHLNAIEPDFIENYGLQMRAGRKFDRAHSTDRRALVITETTAKRFGYPNPEAALNERFRMRGDTFTVVGVAADYHQYGLQRAPEPYIFFQDPTELRRYSVKMSGQNLPETVALVEKIWKETFPTGVYESHFLDVHFDQQYRSEVRTGRIFSIFSGLAIFIACLGLFGLAAFMAVQRTKEIGIRKVLGASVVGITGLLAKDFLKLVLVAFVFASPIAWWAMDKWLADFAYRIDVQWWVFLLAGSAAVVVAFFAVSFQSVRAALANPVKSLRSE